MPQTRNGAIQKVGVQASKNLAVEMLRTTNVLGQSRQMFQKPKDARKKHRDEKHVGHLKKFMETLEKQVYHKARERVNAAGCCEASHTETSIEEGDDGAESPAQDAADSNLSARPSQYSSSDDGGQTGAVPPVEIALDDENDAPGRSSKRQLSLEPPWSMIFGSEGVCLRKSFHGPHVEDAEIAAEACINFSVAQHAVNQANHI